MTNELDAIMRGAAAHLRAGSLHAARTVLDDGLKAMPGQPVLLSFAGTLACEAGDIDQGIALLQQALSKTPADTATRVNLVRALLQRGSLNEAAILCGNDEQIDPRLRRFRAHIRQAQADHVGAANDLRAVVAAFPGEAESWNNLGNALATLNDPPGARRAFDRAIALRPQDPTPALNAAKAMGKSGLYALQLTYAQNAARAFPDMVDAQMEFALALSANRDFEAAEHVFTRVLSLAPDNVAAYLELGLMYENLNRLDDLDGLIERARKTLSECHEIRFLEAWSLRRRGEFAAALPLAENAPATIDEIRRMHLIGEITDRLGDAQSAFAAFSAMKAATKRVTNPAIIADGARFVAEIHSMTAQLPDVAARQDAETARSGEPQPIFIAGFPRSGTTLLDTLLMNIDDLHVCEELPMMGAVEEALGDRARLPDLDQSELDALRDVYFETLNQVSPPPAGKTIVDKFPLHMVRTGLIHRLFPHAKIIFAERHPCDVLLSCFISNFQPNRAMVNFFDLEGAAALYDTAFTAWEAARTLLPLKCHPVRYERLVATGEAEMRELMAFLGRPWTDSIMDNQGSAARRAHIRTASYAQVGEKIYSRSAGRWHRYRQQLEPVMPILAPWAQKMGYSLDDE